MKLKERLKAIHLRKLGKSYSEIRKKVKISKGTLSLWLRNIKLTPEQEKRLYVELRQKNAYRLAKVNQQKRIERTKKIITEAKKETKLLLKNPLFLGMIWKKIIYKCNSKCLNSKSCKSNNNCKQ